MTKSPKNTRNDSGVKTVLKITKKDFPEQRLIIETLEQAIKQLEMAVFLAEIVKDEWLLEKIKATLG